MGGFKNGGILVYDVYDVYDFTTSMIDLNQTEDVQR